MYHPIPAQWLEATNRVDVQFDNGAETKNYSGSGFWVSDQAGYCLFVTNRHVVDMAYRDEKYLSQGYQLSRLTVSSHSAVPRNRGVVVDLERDIDIRMHANYGVDIAILIPGAQEQPDAATPISVPASTHLADQPFFETLPWGAQVTFVSFQAWGDRTTKKPILRTGIVSSDPSDDYSSDIVDRKSALLLEAFSFSRELRFAGLRERLRPKARRQHVDGRPRLSRRPCHRGHVWPHPQPGGHDDCVFHARRSVVLSQIDRTDRNAEPTGLFGAARRRLTQRELQNECITGRFVGCVPEVGASGVVLFPVAHASVPSMIDSSYR